MNRKLNLWSIAIFILSCILAWLVWSGTVKTFDTAFGFVRETSINILFEKIALYFLIAGTIEIVIHISINLIRSIKH